jgi:hypothetical protein
MSAFENAQKFFEACETGKGWQGCQCYVASSAPFACQAGALADVTTVESYYEWMKGLVSGPLPDGHYTLHTSSWDAGTNAAMFSATFHGTHTGDGGPVPPTNKKANADYVYVLKMNPDGKVSDMTKIWNDGHTLAQLGWV